MSLQLFSPQFRAEHKTDGSADVWKNKMAPYLTTRDIHALRLTHKKATEVFEPRSKEDALEEKMLQALVEDLRSKNEVEFDTYFGSLINLFLDWKRKGHPATDKIVRAWLYEDRNKEEAVKRGPRRPIDPLNQYLFALVFDMFDVETLFYHRTQALLRYWREYGLQFFQDCWKREILWTTWQTAVKPSRQDIIDLYLHEHPELPACAAERAVRILNVTDVPKLQRIWAALVRNWKILSTKQEESEFVAQLLGIGDRDSPEWFSTYIRRIAG